MQHTTLGTQWVYDGVHDARYVTMLAAVAMTGQGKAIGLVEYHGRWHVAPAAVRIEGGGWGLERVCVDGFAASAADALDAADVEAANERFSLTVYRRPIRTDRPPLGLAAHRVDDPAPLLLAVVGEL